MDRLVKVEEATVEVHFRPSKRCLGTFRITSLIHTMPVAVKLTTTRPASYSFSPDAVALLPPLSSAVFTLVLLPTAIPPLASPPDFILVGAVLAPALHRAPSAALRCFFSRPALSIFRDASLPIHLVRSQALCSLHLPGVGSKTSLVSRVIPSFSPPKLAADLLFVGGNIEMPLGRESGWRRGGWRGMPRWCICMRFCFRGHNCSEQPVGTSVN
ncbi:hypothetical protein KSP40_PGU008806 [Platanthera guangdongensis]|uniref:Uncharacterized protein n=1 Tax=Platanthera guangdongensis TaxID=2320717 RepID=A0ABR2MDB8_9ASPA